MEMTAKDITGLAHKALSQEGLSLRRAGDQLGVSHTTVRRAITWDPAAPEKYLQMSIRILEEIGGYTVSGPQWNVTKQEVAS